MNTNRAQCNRVELRGEKSCVRSFITLDLVDIYTHTNEPTTELWLRTRAGCTDAEYVYALKMNFF